MIDSLSASGLSHGVNLYDTQVLSMGYPGPLSYVQYANILRACLSCYSY